MAPKTAKRTTRKPAAETAPAARPPADLSNGTVPWLTILKAAHNNLKQVDVPFPLGRFTCVTGVSGSGKSSLVNDILYEALARDLNRATTAEPGAHAGITGLEHLDKIIAIDQSPIGRTPRSNPATYIKVFDEIRALFTKLPDAKLRGYKPGRFSFNVATRRGGGRCEACEGNGSNKIEMDFLADVWVTCPVCEGHRFGRETLQIRYKGKSIADVLEMEVWEASEHFENVPRLRNMLQTLHDVGLDYIQLGQPSTTLSGGEAQRIKLARELVKKPTGRTMYVLDEPTTGLHFDDIRKLLDVLHGFVDAGNTVVVIEHNLDVLKTADWIIDLGPEGGEKGGCIVAQGTPEEVAACQASYTGAALREVLLPAGDGTLAKATKEGAAASSAVVAQRTVADAVPPLGVGHEMITVVGARQHNLKDVTVSFPRNKTTVCTGVSGSGKTSFAIDTVFTEGYRRYVESLSAYARQFLGQMAKPRIDHIEGLSPAICIEQRAAGKSPRSTVGTVTEIYDYMRVLWARVGVRYCPSCQLPIGTQTADEIVARVMSLEPGTPIILLAPTSLGDGETYASLFNRLKSSGYTRVRIDGQIRLTAECTTLDARRKHRVEIVVDRTLVRARSRSRIAESIEHALALGRGVMSLLIEEVETVHEDEGAELEAAPSPEDSPVENTADTAPQSEARPAYRVHKTPAREFMYSQKLACVHCGTSYEELGPMHFSFNSPLGWCETCEGLGVQRGAPAGAIVKHPDRSLFDGAVDGWPNISRRTPMGRLLESLCRHLDVEASAPLQDWTPEQKRTLMFGTAGTWLDGSEAFAGVRFHWRGFFPAIDQATRNSWTFRYRLRNAVTDIPCVTCRGGRLRPDAAAVRLGASAEAADGERAAGEPRKLRGRTIVEVCEMPLEQCAEYFRTLELDDRERRIAGELLKEIQNRLQFLIDVGLHYLTLHRSAPTLSGGEAQRIRLASQIGSGLSGVLYVLDEPTIGLHPRDTERLVRALGRLRDLGNTLLMVEHDRDVIANADRLLDFGPRAGREGGEIVAQGTPAEFLNIASRRQAGATKRARKATQTAAAAPDTQTDEATGSLTKAYLGGTSGIAIPTNRRPVALWEDSPPVRRRATAPKRAKGSRPARKQAPPSDAPESPAWLVIRGARQNNLKNLVVPIPLGRFVCVTGVSGSGKSSLVNDILWPCLARDLQRSSVTVGEHDTIEGIEHIDKVINVDQTPIGTTPASNPATYTGVFDWIRELFARLPDSKMRGYNANRFSFNRPGGRCEPCQGYGQRCIEMHFMPDVWVECETCRGRRYNPETLEVCFKDKNIADVLELRVVDALRLFENVPKVRRMLQTLADVGLDYIQLGQPAPTLSGGEAQRVKLAGELGKPDTGRTLYVLDEPTTGLHFDDIRKLLNVIQRLVDLGNSVLIVEHNLDVLKCADWIIDLGPEAGDAGGQVVATGTPEMLVETLSSSAVTKRVCPSPSHTAVALAPVLAAGRYEERSLYDAEAHAERELAVEKAGYGDVGKDVRMPWQVDGRKWHLEQRRSRDEQPCRWESEALEYVLDLVHKAGKFAPTNWNARASVEVTAPDAKQWFLHALTGGEWLLDFYFHAPRGSFKWLELDAQLGLKTLDERDDLQAYGDWARVDVRPRRSGLEAVAISVHDKKEIDTPGFRKFIRDAVRLYFKSVAQA